MTGAGSFLPPSTLELAVHARIEFREPGNGRAHNLCIRPSVGIARSSISGLSTHRLECHEFARLCDIVGMPVSGNAARQLAEYLVNGHKNYQTPIMEEVLKSFESGAMSAIDNEFSAKISFVLSSEQLHYLEPEKYFIPEIWTKFPSLTYDLTETCKCLAFERYTASAFHALRCLEAVIRAMSKCLGIPDPIKGSDRNWGKMLPRLKEEKERRWPSSGLHTGDGITFDELYGALAGMQNPYRNATMHLEKQYTHEEARHLLELVNGLLARGARRMDENGDPKA